MELHFYGVFIFHIVGQMYVCVMENFLWERQRLCFIQI